MYNLTPIISAIVAAILMAVYLMDKDVGGYDPDNLFMRYLCFGLSITFIYVALMTSGGVLNTTTATTSGLVVVTQFNYSYSIPASINALTSSTQGWLDLFYTIFYVVIIIIVIIRGVIDMVNEPAEAGRNFNNRD